MRYIRLIKKRMYHRPMLGRVRWASMMRFPFYPARRWLSGFIRANVNGRFAVPILRQCQEPFNPVFTTNADNCGSNAASIGSSVPTARTPILARSNFAYRDAAVTHWGNDCGDDEGNRLAAA